MRTSPFVFKTGTIGAAQSEWSIGTIAMTPFASNRCGSLSTSALNARGTDRGLKQLNWYRFFVNVQLRFNALQFPQPIFDKIWEHVCVKSACSMRCTADQSSLMGVNQSLPSKLGPVPLTTKHVRRCLLHW